MTTGDNSNRDSSTGEAWPWRRPPGASCGPGWVATGSGRDCSRWYAVASSRLGRPVENRRRWFRLLQRAVQRAVAEDAALVIVEGTAPEPWVRRAAELFRARTVSIEVHDLRQRDRALVQLADRVFVLRARRGGRIARLAAERIAADPTAVCVAIHDEPQDAGAELVARGGVGWWLCEPSPPPQPPDSRVPKSPAARSPVPGSPAFGMGVGVPVSGSQTEVADGAPAAELPDLGDGDWLVHCTRGHSGRWSWQSETQWRDEVLLGGEGGRALEAAEVLERILREGQLRGGAAVTSTAPVVCFSAVPLAELLARRVFRSHLGRWDYEPFGVAVRRSRIAELGGQPVIYAKNFAAAGLPAEQRWRFQAAGQTVDWRAEQEWRVQGSLDLELLASRDAVVFVGERAAAAHLAPLSRWPLAVVESWGRDYGFVVTAAREPACWASR